MSLGNGDPPRPCGGRAAVIVLAGAAALGWSATHTSGACGCGQPVFFGRDEPSFDRLAGRSRQATLILYGPRSRSGVFTAWPRPSGFVTSLEHGLEMQVHALAQANQA